MAARSQVHTNTSSRPAGRFLQRLSFQQTEFQCEPPPLQRRRLTQGNTIQADTGIHEQAAGISWKHYRMHQTSTLERSCWSNWHWKVLQWKRKKRNRRWKYFTNTGKVFKGQRVKVKLFRSWHFQLLCVMSQSNCCPPCPWHFLCLKNGNCRGRQSEGVTSHEG